LFSTKSLALFYVGTFWAGYENEESVGMKMDYVKSSGLGGGMTWAIDLDDFRNLCGRGTHPLQTVIYEKLKDYYVPDSTDETTTKVIFV
jgi:chitinase